MARPNLPALRGGSQIALFDEVPPPRPSSRDMGFHGSKIVGYLLIAVFVVGFGAWAGFAPLESATVAVGEVIVEGNRRSVQHLEGGIVRNIRVVDGSRVAEGEPLIILDDTQARASMQLLSKRWQDNSALAARLTAEQIEADRIDFPSWLMEAAMRDSNAASVVATQETIFRSRAETMASQLTMLLRRSAQFEEEIVGLEAEVDAIDQELVHIRAELADIEDLVSRGLARRERLYSLRRQEASILGRRGRNMASIARARQSISENEIRGETLQTEARETAIRELRDVQAELADIGERLLAARDVLERTTISAPVAGTIVNLQVHTNANVIGPGVTLMEIVPDGEHLVVQARLDPADIDVVKAGLDARVRIIALNARTSPELHGWVERVSADRLIDPNTGVPYYEARIRLTETEVARLQGKQLAPGMPVEVMITTGDTTLLHYLVQPITDLMRRGFKES